jgi:FkbM family methyltransferase
MAQLYTLLKRKALTWLPEPALRFLKKIHYARILESFSLEDQPDLKIVHLLVQPGEYAIDIGANIGVYTKNLSELVGPNGKVFSVEPVPSTYEILCSNIRKLRLRNAEPINCAISDTPGSVTMEIPHYSTGGEDFYQAHIITGDSGKNQNVRRVTVEAATIDSKFESIADKVSLVKCDVEGHDLACIRGARKFLEKSNTAWLIEVSGKPDDANSPANALFKILTEKSYTIWWFDGVHLRRRNPGDKSTNYFFLRENHIAILRKQNPALFN